MINAISGKLAYVRPPRVVLATAFGIEFEIIVSAITLSRLMNLREEEKENVRLLTAYFHNDETGILYGFNDDDEKDLFHELLKVNGIGPKQALRILSSSTPEEFRSYLKDDNIRALSKVPGIGAKTASKIILDLKSKLVKAEDKSAGKAKAKTKASVSPEYADVLASLVEMGYEKELVASAILDIEKEIANGKANVSDEEMFRRVFERISKIG